TIDQLKGSQLSADLSTGITQEEFASQEVSNQRAQPKPPEQKATPESSTRDLNTTDNSLSHQRDIMDDLNSQTIILAEDLKDKIDDTETLITETENASGPWENSISILASLNGLDLLTFERDAPELGLLLTEEEEVEEDQPSRSNHFFIGLGAGVAFASNSGNSNISQSSGKNDPALMSLGISAGYNLNEKWELSGFLGREGNISPSLALSSQDEFAADNDFPAGANMGDITVVDRKQAAWLSEVGIARHLIGGPKISGFATLSLQSRFGVKQERELVEALNVAEARGKDKVSIQGASAFAPGIRLQGQIGKKTRWNLDGQYVLPFNKESEVLQPGFSIRAGFTRNF
ncbi:MAG: hypothetical protein HKN16_05440, partial [Saprospiraceae bacterium]|nr:hypothetical protein [Saprospiraceae bacterium]